MWNSLLTLLFLSTTGSKVKSWEWERDRIFGALRREEVCHNVCGRMNGAGPGTVISGQHFGGHRYKGVNEKNWDLRDKWGSDVLEPCRL